MLYNMPYSTINIQNTVSVINMFLCVGVGDKLLIFPINYDKIN